MMRKIATQVDENFVLGRSEVACKRVLRSLVITSVLVLGVAFGQGATAEPPGESATTPGENPRPPLVLADQGYFFVGGEYLPTEDNLDQTMANQMFVHFQIPQNLNHPYPIVMIHGGSQTGTNFMGTPDGREGWADFFLRKGFAVYVVDQPGRGKSAFNKEAYGELSGPSEALGVEQRFTAPEDFNLWPQASLHTQWPGTGRVGDPIFDEFFASQVPGITDGELRENLNQDAVAALLDKIGPAIILTHSQSGPFGWLIADARPNLVKGILALEPSGPPFFNSAVTGGDLARPWGITSTEITYGPPVSDPSELERVQEDEPDAPNLVQCWSQAEPVRQLPNLQGIPILIFVGEASYHAQYDHCTAEYLTQAGVENDFVRLENVGIHGNGHMVMLEKNNLEVAEFMLNWINENIDVSATRSQAPTGDTMTGGMSGGGN